MVNVYSLDHMDHPRLTVATRDERYLLFTNGRVTILPVKGKMITLNVCKA